jgi:hypothetical protein
MSYKTLLLIIIFFIVFYLYIYFSENGIEHMVNIPYDKNMTWYSKCKNDLGETVLDILNQNNIKYNEKNWTLYFPCGYTYNDKEFKELPKMSNAKYCLIDNIDELAAKDYLWKNLVSHVGLEKAKEVAPNTFVLTDKSDMERFNKEYDPKKIYIMKKNIQRQEGLLLTKSKDEILKGSSQGYVIVQELLQDPYTIDGRKTNMRFYVLIICDKNNYDVYVYDDGFMYYTKEKFVKNSLRTEPNITTGYIERSVYKVNPLTHNDLRKYLDNPKRTLSHYEIKIKEQLDKVKNNRNIKTNVNMLSDVFFFQIFQTLMVVFASFSDKIGKLSYDNNIYFQIFGVDIASDENYHAKIMEINKGPDLGAKDERDSELKHNMFRDVIKKLGGINDTNNKFIPIFMKSGIHNPHYYINEISPQ